MLEQIYCTLQVFCHVQRQACGYSAMMCRVNSYNEEKLDFTTCLLPRPCGRLLVNEDRLLLIVLQQAIPPARGGQTCSSGVDTVEAVVVTSLFVFSMRRRAKRNPDARVTVSCVEQSRIACTVHVSLKSLGSAPCYVAVLKFKKKQSSGPTCHPGDCSLHTHLVKTGIYILICGG